jgi:hypothetical protein
MIDEQKRSNHSFTVEFRLWGVDLDPEHVSQVLRLKSCQSGLGDPGGRPSKPFWHFNGFDAESLEWQTLEAGLVHVCSKLRPQRPAVIEMVKLYSSMWWCGHFQSSYDGGPILSAATMAEVAAFGAPFFIDNYFSSGD